MIKTNPPGQNKLFYETNRWNCKEETKLFF